jgi:AraC family transcriptional regulator
MICLQGDDVYISSLAAFFYPLISVPLSHTSGWNGIHVESHIQPATDTGEHVLSTHCVTFALNPFYCERWLDGSFYQESLQQGTFAVVPAGAAHRCATSISNTLVFMILVLTPNFFSQIAQEWGNPDTIQIVPRSATSQDSLFLSIGLALNAEIESGYLGGRLYGESLATALAAHLLRHYCNRTPQITTHSKGLPKLKLNRAIDYIQAHLTSDDLNLGAIATQLSMSQYYVCTLFKKSMGISPWQYVLQQRIERAKELLQTREASISEVALLCGFSSQTHLNKNFHKLVGVTPKAYQRK